MNDVELSVYAEVNKVLSEQEISQRHSYFQLKYFLIGKEPTVQSKMWQCLREMKNRNDTAKNIELETEDLKDKLELLDISVERIRHDMENIQITDQVSNNLYMRECEIKIRQFGRQKKSLEQNIKEIEERKKSISEECRFFLETYKNLLKIEPLKHFDDLEAQKQYWHERLTQKVNLKMLTQNSIDTELIETIVALPDDVKIKQQTLQTLNVKQNEILLKLAETAKRIETKIDKEN